MLAVGPIAILPSPLLATVPTAIPFTVTSGTATWNAAGTTGTINSSNRAVLTWGTTAGTVPLPYLGITDGTTVSNFNILSGETFNFVLPSGGAVLNRVSAGSNTTNSIFNSLGAAAAVVNGQLLSNGQVVILANGNIIVGAGAQISTASGLVLSTLAETDFGFTATGNLALSGASQGTIYLGTGTAVASAIGNLSSYAGTVTSNNLTVSGDMILGQTGSGTGLVLTSASPTTVGGNFTATSNNGAITQGAGSLLAANGITSLSSGTAPITLGTATNDFKTLTINTTGLLGNATVVDANIITLGASNIGGDLSVTAAGTLDTTAIASSGTLAIGGNATIIATGAANNSGINIQNSSTVAGALLLSAANASVTWNGVGNLTLGNSTAAGATLTAGVRSNLTVTTNNVLTIGNTVSVTAATTNNGVITLTGGSIVQNANVTTASGNGTLTLNATAAGGNITLGNVTNSGSGGVALRTAGGSINQVAGTTIVTANVTGQTSVVNVGTGTANLTNANNFGTGTILQVTAGTATVNNTGATGSLTLGTTNVTGNYAVLNNGASNTGVVIGTGLGSAGQSITVGGVLSISTAGTGTITDNDYSPQNIFGGLNLTAGSGAVTLDAAVANGSLSPSVQYGQIKINTTGAATIAERTTVNLGNITAASLNATSTQGGIINTGDLNITGAASFTSNVSSTSVITNGTNSIGTANFLASGGALTVAGGGVTLGATTNVTSGDLLITSTNGGVITLGGATVAGSLTINSSDSITTAALTNTTVGGNLSLTATNTGATSINQNATGFLKITGTTTIASSGNVTLNSGNDFIGPVVLNQAATTGDATIGSARNLTISGVSGGLVTALAGSPAGVSIDNPWNLVIGNLTVGSLSANATNGGGGNSGTITQAAGTSIFSYGLTQFTSQNANIIVGNNGNNFGRVEAKVNGTDASRTVTIVEDGTMKVGNLSSRGSSSLTSRFGSIIEDPAANVVIANNGTLTATALNGSINIGNTTHTTGTTTGNVVAFVASAPTGSVTVQTSDSLALGAINANSLIVTATNNITQSAALNIFGTASFTTTNAGASRNITLTNSGNNFGPISVTLGNNTGNANITEDGTLNLRKVTMVGGGNSTFTATSVNGGIIDTGLGGVKLGGNSTASGSGVVTLTATNGNITIDDPTTDFFTSSGVSFNGKDVTLSILGTVGSSLVLGSAATPSVATGNLIVSSALGNIANAGALSVTGNAFLQAFNGSIVINQPGVNFGTLKFIGQQVSISESSSMDILTGSASFGAANLVSTGDLSIVNTGGLVTFGSTVNLTSTGNITLPKLVQAAGLLRVTHTGTANLGALSISNDLGGITPVDVGTGAYTPPQP